MHKSPLITIATVTYNAGKVIEKTLKSIKNQDFKDFEHLIIDGASHDDTIQKIKTSGISATHIISERDNGLYDAMNKALKHAKGEYIIFLNAGDSFHSSHTLSLYAQAAQKGADIIYGDTLIIDNDERIMGKRHLSAPRVLSRDSFSQGMLICHQAFMVKKSLAPLYDLKYRFSADYDWCIKCIDRADIDSCVNLNTVTVNYLNEGLTDHNKRASLKERFRIMSSRYGVFKTLARHVGFVFRALKRGKI